MAAERVDVAVAREVWRAGDTVIDVRRPEEYAGGHISGAVNVSLDSLVAGEKSLPPGQVLVVCSLGGRSWRGAQLLALKGRDALCLDGGTKAWQAAGLPITRGAGAGHARR